MLQKLTKKIAPIVGRSCDNGIATSKRFVANGGYLFIAHRRKQELYPTANHINQNVTVIQGEIADLSDLDLIDAAAGTAEGPPRRFNATQVNDFLIGYFLNRGIFTHRKLRRIC
jgi:NADP-dependent 3-hydroxy acid dehydrogenase YdfG